uniref:Uncharacterized protein n=1 Tax=Lactuca sativa TaxID=4236 RepID=A0A9R1VZW0_LACSA|nr:hypothetical protein LSAT_V11C400187920 [Lactuca sativa]
MENPLRLISKLESRLEYGFEDSSAICIEISLRDSSLGYNQLYLVKGLDITSFSQLKQEWIRENQSLRWAGLNSLVESICLSPAPDRWCCSLSGMGDFSMASTCSFIDGKLLPAMSSPSRWIKEVPININLALDKLSNGPILDRRLSLLLKCVNVGVFWFLD